MIFKFLSSISHPMCVWLLFQAIGYPLRTTDFSILWLYFALFRNQRGL